MAYTIKGLAKANECATLDRTGLASVWEYWIACNSCDKQSVNDFKRLRKADRKDMMDFLRAYYPEVANHILNRLEF